MEKKRRRRRRGEEVTYLLSPRRLRPRAVLARGLFFTHVRRRNVSPRGEKDRGDIAEPVPSSPHVVLACGRFFSAARKRLPAWGERSRRCSQSREFLIRKRTKQMHEAPVTLGSKKLHVCNLPAVGMAMFETVD
ncbi:hypothetical protein GW17_00018807 [Ensete ventricosum]|nr:hypothetical protein GW17_00018807 [Ensete ventricosum]